MLRSIRGLFSAKKPNMVLRRRPGGSVRLAIESLEARDLMAAGLDVAIVDPVQFAPATTDVGQIAIVQDSATAGVIAAQAPTRIDATSLNRTDIMLDYGAFDISQVLTTALQPGDHLLSVYGHSFARFQVGVNGTVSYDAALEGILTGQGSNTLQVNGAAINIAAAGLNGDYLSLDHVVFNADATLETHLLPGRHYLQGYGNVHVFFNVTEAGTIDYAPELEGILTGQGTRALQVHGAPITIDAAALHGNYQTLDYTAFDADATLQTHLLPGRHFLAGYGGDPTFFEVGVDGTIAYDTALEGILGGQGTRALEVHGALVHLDASALPGSYVSLDYITLDGDLAQTPRLLPGRHVIQTYGGSAVFFRVSDAGNIDYEANLDGELAGRGTDSLTVQGLRLTIDPRSLNASSYLSMDYTMFTPDQPFEVRVMPGTHFLFHDTTVSWFTVHADGTVTGDPAALNTIQVSPIAEKLASIPDAAELLGAALGGEQASATGGHFQLFERGGIYSSAAGTYVLAADFEPGYITADRISTFAITGAIAAKYAEKGGPSGILGVPTGSTTQGVDGLWYANFEHGVIYWTSSTGAHELHGPIWEKWKDLLATWTFSHTVYDGTHFVTVGNFEFGYPTTDILTVRAGVEMADFEGGTIYWSAATGAHETHGVIGNNYKIMGDSFLGLPISDVKPFGGDGLSQNFERGIIYWTPANGVVEVHGFIAAKYAKLGGPAGFLGMSISNESDVSGGRVSHFEHGSIFCKWAAAEAFEVHGDIRAKWESMGGVASQLGYPIADEEMAPNGTDRISRFEWGSIYWTEATRETKVTLSFGPKSGFSFGNFKFNVSFPLVHEAFGSQAVYVGDIPTLGGLAFTAFAAATLNDNGACFGMSLASLRLMHHPEWIAGNGLPAGADSVTWNLPANGQLYDWIEQLHLYQFSTEVITYVAAWQVTLPTSIEFRPLVQTLLNANDPPLISITNGLGKGHAMVVTGLRSGDQSDGQDYYLKVYDPNRPGQTPEIHVLADNRWLFQMSDGSWWEGGFGSLMVIPYGTIPADRKPGLPGSMENLFALGSHSVQSMDVGLLPVSNMPDATILGALTVDCGVLLPGTSPRVLQPRSVLGVELDPLDDSMPTLLAPPPLLTDNVSLVNPSGQDSAWQAFWEQPDPLAMVV